MASACVNNMGMSPDNFLDGPPVKFPSHGWLSPRTSFGREYPEEEATKASATVPSPDDAREGKPQEPDPEISSKDFSDFEFRLQDPVTLMLPADELFFEGRLVPLRPSATRNPKSPASASSDARSPDTPKFRHRWETSSTDPHLFSPKAPTCSSRWKELLGLKKLYQNSNSKQDGLKMGSHLSSHSRDKSAARSLKHFLHRSPKSTSNASTDSSLNLPLLKDPETESVPISSRPSLSSSSSGHEHDDLPRLSLDSDKPSTLTRNTRQATNNRSRVRVAKHGSVSSSENQTAHTRVGRSPMGRASQESRVPFRGVSEDSPRMNSSGKIVFHNLERSSSSPSSFNGGPRYKHRGMERSYSANVRVTPVLNVPVCSLRGSSKSNVFGFPLFSQSQQKKENGGGGCGGGGGNRIHRNHRKNRRDRT